MRSEGGGHTIQRMARVIIMMTLITHHYRAHVNLSSPRKPNRRLRRWRGSHLAKRRLRLRFRMRDRGKRAALRLHHLHRHRCLLNSCRLVLLHLLVLYRLHDLNHYLRHHPRLSKLRRRSRDAPIGRRRARLSSLREMMYLAQVHPVRQTQSRGSRGSRLLVSLLRNTMIKMHHIRRGRSCSGGTRQAKRKMFNPRRIGIGSTTGLLKKSKINTRRRC